MALRHLIHHLLATTLHTTPSHVSHVWTPPSPNLSHSHSHVTSRDLDPPFTQYSLSLFLSLSRITHSFCEKSLAVLLCERRRTTKTKISSIELKKACFASLSSSGFSTVGLRVCLLLFFFLAQFHGVFGLLLLSLSFWRFRR